MPCLLYTSEGKLKNAKQELYRDLYLFCAFTGLSFADMRKDVYKRQAVTVWLKEVSAE